MIGHISANQTFKYTKHENPYLIQKQYLHSKTKHMSIRTSKSQIYRKIQVAKNKLIIIHVHLKDMKIAFKLKDMKIASDNKSQRDVKDTHNAMVISESNTSSETVKKTSGLSEIDTSRDASKSVTVAEDMPVILEMTGTVTNPTSAKKKTVQSYTVRADDQFQQDKRKSRVVYGKSTKNTLRAAPEVQFAACISGVDSVI